MVRKEENSSFNSINRLAIPAILGGISEPLISLADNAVVGKLGIVELGAVGIATSFFTFFLWGLSSLKSAISSLVAKYYGANELEKTKTLIPQALGISFFVGILFYVATVPFSHDIFLLYEAEGMMLDQAKAYYNIRAFGYPLSLTVFSIFGIFRGYQNTSWAMYISLFGALVNVVLDCVFVFGIGMEPMGVEGAAWASVISQTIILLLSIFCLWYKLPHSFQFSLQLNPEIKTMLGIGGNLFLRTISLNIAFYLASRFATSYGDEYIAAHSIAVNIWLFSSFFIDGYANAGNAIAGKLFGSGNNQALYNTVFRLLKISIVVGACLSLVYMVSYFQIIKLFSNEIKVQNQFHHIFWVVIISQPINAIAFTLDGIFKGLGKAKLLRNVLFLGTFLVFTPSIILLDHYQLYLKAIWFSFLFWMIFRSASLFILFKGQYKPEIKTI